MEWYVSLTDSREDSTLDAASAAARTNPRVKSGAIEGPEVIEALLAKNEEVFARVVRAHHSSMVRVAMVHVSSREIAEEVAQEVWTALVEGIARFEGRSTLKTWLFGILLNRAKTRGLRESRHVSLSSFESEESGRCELLERASVSEVQSPGKSPWVWGTSSNIPSPEATTLHRELESRRAEAIAQLPLRQRTVITLRDVEGWSSKEVCNALTIRSTHQRVLLHRARVQVREALRDIKKRS
jgi:RNA polymerase sigma-70 factor (ECF subfamily)